MGVAGWVLGRLMGIWVVESVDKCSGAAVRQCVVYRSDGNFD